MPLATISTKPAANCESRSTAPLSTEFASAYSVAEINAYIAIRDQLLGDSEEILTSAKLASTSLANDFVLGCLQLARSPYQAQCLSEADAIQERKRCEAVRNRIAELRNRAV